MKISSDDIKRFIVQSYPQAFGDLNSNPDGVPDDLDLLQQGVVDSFGILELISSLEQQFQVSIDLEGLPAEHLTVIGPFSRYVASNATRRVPNSEQS